ncbi:copper amine oxidase N-terminal domain-containing protein [Cellulosilyticum sp. I15G10I2]|uniref:copper amine oxidase N-terminal domain-containing protein n=1 Tax=Cellulosilyticum sp. I15G10I2 TaxID=1892843 RepID=UPI00085C4389|nr:copper amine oxidase N-terminal domain-containing protein [Cellulosilyticum sp. I15G10I2]
MKRIKTNKMLCLTLGLGIMLSGVALQAANMTKTLKAVYNNIKISYNGQIKSLKTEPFMVEGITYVPLRAIGEIMGADVNWGNNTVYINGQQSSTYSDEQIAAINYENALLRQQLEMAKKDLEALTGAGGNNKNLTTEAIVNTLNKIKTNYKNTYDVGWGYDLQIVSGRLELTVTYDSRYDEADFDKITSEELKQFIKEMCYDISAAHKEVEIRGTLKDNKNDLERASFKYSKAGAYEYNEAADFSLKDFEKELEKKYNVINTIGFSIPIGDIELGVKNDILTFTLTTELRPSGTLEDYRGKWNVLGADNKSELENLFKKIKEDIQRQYSSYDSIVGGIRDSSTGSSLGVYTNDDKLYINTINTN